MSIREPHGSFATAIDSWLVLNIDIQDKRVIYRATEVPALGQVGCNPPNHPSKHVNVELDWGNHSMVSNIPIPKYHLHYRDQYPGRREGQGQPLVPVL